MAEIPRMNLSPEATPWGRAMQDRVTSQEAEIARLRQDTENTLRSFNGALTNLGYQSFAASGVFGLSLSLAGAGMTSAVGASVTFTITERRLVSATCVTNYAYNKTSGGDSRGTGVVSVNIAGISYYGNILFGTVAASGQQGASVVGAGALALDPGTYTVTCGAELYVTTAASSPVGTATMTDPYVLQVQVHGRA